MPKKFRLGNLLGRKGGSKYKPGSALPPSQTGGANNHNNNQTGKKSSPTKKSHGLFSKAHKGPGGMEVATAAAGNSKNNNTSSAQQHDDLVSEITPVTGLPPDSPDRVHKLPSLLHPQHPPRPSGNGLYGGINLEASPSRGDMKIQIRRSEDEQDDISVMTPVTGVPPITPDNKAGNRQQRYAPPQMLGYDDDEDSRDLMVFEDDEGGSGSYSSYPGINNNNNSSGPMLGETDDVKFRLNPRISGQLVSSMGMETILKSTTNSNNNTATNYSNNANTTKSSKYWDKLKSKQSWLTQTKYFQKAIDSSFEMVDWDKSGDVTLEELYAGLLLIHLKMAVYVGAPACRPASKEYVTDIFHLLDTDGDKTLNKEEFATVMKVLYSQVFTRIVIHWALTLMIVPVVSKYIINYSILFYTIMHDFWKDHDDELDPIQRLLWRLWVLFLTFTPTQLDRVGTLVWMAFCKVPWKTMPFTILTLAQTSIALPYALKHVEDFFRRVAHSDERFRRERGKLKEC